MRALAILLVLALGACVALQAAAVAGAWWWSGHGEEDRAIRWLESFRPILVWDSGLGSQIDQMYRERIRRDLDAGRIDRAVVSLRLARARLGQAAVKADPALMALGVETYTRAADRMEARGLLSAAASWDDSLFVMAIRAPQPHHRYAALAAFQEGLDLRVRNGEPCQAVSRVEWAKRGLGGQIPGFQPSIEEDLRIQCKQARGLAR